MALTLCVSFQPEFKLQIVVPSFPFYNLILDAVRCIKFKWIYLSTWSTVCSFQSGFRRWHSTETLMIVVDGVWLDISGRASIMILLDFSKLFGTIDHELICLKLINIFNFSIRLIQLVGPVHFSMMYIIKMIFIEILTIRCIIFTRMISEFIARPTWTHLVMVLGLFKIISRWTLPKSIHNVFGSPYIINMDLTEFHCNLNGQITPFTDKLTNLGIILDKFTDDKWVRENRIRYIMELNIVRLVRQSFIESRYCIVTRLVNT